MQRGRRRTLSDEGRTSQGFDEIESLYNEHQPRRSGSLAENNQAEWNLTPFGEDRSNRSTITLDEPEPAVFEMAENQDDNVEEIFEVQL